MCRKRPYRHELLRFSFYLTCHWGRRALGTAGILVAMDERSELGRFLTSPDATPCFPIRPRRYHDEALSWAQPCPPRRRTGGHGLLNERFMLTN